METGFRVSESCSLSIADVHGLDTAYPFLTLHKTPFRRLKAKNSIRFIPLIGGGLGICPLRKGQVAISSSHSLGTQWLRGLGMRNVLKI